VHDLVRGGRAEAASRPWTSFEQMSERLVDAQAPGLARLVRDLGGLPHRTSRWPERMLIDLGRLALLLDARSARLAPAGALGWASDRCVRRVGRLRVLAAQRLVGRTTLTSSRYGGGM